MTTGDLSGCRPEALPLRLARIHRAARVGRRVALVLPEGPWPSPGPGAVTITDLVTGAGFDPGGRRSDGSLVMTRIRTLPDTVGADMTMLVVGLNPSLYSADVGVGFARPGNRFWPALTRAGLVERDRDAVAALVRHGIGMTDLVKRATSRSAELSAAEYSGGLARVERLVAWLAPGVVCLVGLEGWRTVVDRRATAGLQERELGGRRVYLMGSTSGLNAHQQLPAAVTHLLGAFEVGSAARTR